MKNTTVYVIMLLLAGVVLAEYDRKSGGGDQQGVQKTVTFEQGTDFFKVKCTNKGDDRKLQVTVRTEGNSPLRFRVKMFAKGGDSRSRLQLRLTFASIVEFHETSPTFDGYNASVDGLVKQFLFNNSAWRTIGNATSTKDSTTGVTTYRLMLAYPHPDDQQKNLLQANVSFGDGLFTVDGVEYSPEQFKIDIGIYNWPWVNNTNYLALETKVQSRAQRRIRAGNTEGECNCAEGDFSARFSWVGTASADGSTGNIVVTSKKEDVTADADPDAEGETETGNRWYFSFNHAGANKIIWDPVIEASPATRAGIALLTFFVAILSMFF